MNAEYPPPTQAWMGESAQSLYRHKDAGLNGVRCGFYMGGYTTVRVSLTWDHVTCPKCLALKTELEPWTEQIDTRGD